MMYPEPEWKMRMRVPVSKLEVETITEMGKRKLNRGLTSNEPVILTFCKPDLKWDFCKMAVFLDGIAVHSSETKCLKDQAITDALIDRGWRVLRIRYKSPASETRKKEIWDKIQAFLETSEAFCRATGLIR